MGRPLPPSDSLGNITLPGVTLPYRNVVFMMDPVLRPIEEGDRLLAFVQVLPFDDATFAEMQAIQRGRLDTILKARLEADPLGLVDG